MSRQHHYPPVSSQARAMPLAGEGSVTRESEAVITDDWIDDSEELLEFLHSIVAPAHTNNSPPPSPSAVDHFDSVGSIPTRLWNVAIGSPRINEDHENDSGVEPRNRIVEDGLLREHYRRRQRSYERRYRKRQQASLVTIRNEWMKAEIAFHRLLQSQARSFQAVQPATLEIEYALTMFEARALLQDTVLLRTMNFWKKLFAFRNYTITDDELAKGLRRDEVTAEAIIRTHKEWSQIDQKILGACILKPFKPLQFEFQW